MYQYGRAGGTPYPGCSHKPPAPGPAPGPPSSGPGDFDCEVRLLAMEFARGILGDRTDLSWVATGLGLDLPEAAACAKSGSIHEKTKPTAIAGATAVESGAAKFDQQTFYVDVKTGTDNDSCGAQVSAPCKSLAKMQTVVRKTIASSAGKVPITVNVREGE